MFAILCSDIVNGGKVWLRTSTFPTMEEASRVFDKTEGAGAIEMMDSGMLFFPNQNWATRGSLNPE